MSAIVTAYNRHHNLVIRKAVYLCCYVQIFTSSCPPSRPDDVWIAILSQFYLFVNAHAEELRSKFVPHEGKEEIKVYVEAPSRYYVSYDWMAEEMTKKMKEKIVDPELVKFIIPKFSTTTPIDTAVGCVMMMGTLKHYFDFVCCITCGIPEITILGTKEDYKDILKRLDKFEEFGEEPRVFAALLRPIVREFIDVFNVQAKDPSAAINIDFWSRILHYESGGSGPDYISGWATAFCAWNKDGKWQGPKLDTFSEPISEKERNESIEFYKKHPKSRGIYYGPPALFLGDVRYPVVEFENVPNGFCEVDVLIDDHGTKYDCMMVAGHVGFTISGERSDTLQPSPHWFMFEKGKEAIRQLD
ncbi:hypothetical protein SCHPADRAFT_917878 [Schizopora paradoxa]|uniref:DUF4419 domain-containing protein n=1 Tax=Schizopora paradoxa TaxID=27342 RepID=A0A0H2RJ79_9AGAM|nr:hypothetical protein SCHPADRAFT_917878 [Schizopora paradoxa]